MKSAKIPLDSLLSSGKWRAELFVYEKLALQSKRFKSAKLIDVVEESKIARNPRELGGNFYYIGLENIAPVTGDPLNIEKKNAEQVRSRSKEFSKGDVLYGRLRPYLRKSFYVESPFDKGICSTEFIVLNPNAQLILGEFLREVLITKEITDQLVRLQSGASLPRVSAKDLLAIKIPLPSMDVQKNIVEELRQLKSERLNFERLARECIGKSQSVLVENIS